ncbi:SAM-dependent methyltransferase; O-methyltransferase [unidentified eubacterium SCB49]|nr:SAM-dependent methyltransferase; O-methyltransferase [unidentified eubacterium SCB49]
MLQHILSYLKFLKNSSNQHGVHSPFVYQLLTECLYTKQTPEKFSIVKKHRKWLLQNNNEIEVTDFGAGSRVFKSNLRKVSAIAKNAGMTQRRQRLLSKLIAYLKPNEILEIGTSVGLATAAIWSGSSPSSKITTVEGCPATSGIARKGFEHFSIHNIDQATMKFDQFFESENFRNKIDFAFIDGNHSKKSTLDYFEKLLSRMTNDGIIIFDDIYWSTEMTEAWKDICAHPKVTVSIDTYQWGLVFFRKEQQKEHFTIRV